MFSKSKISVAPHACSQLRVPHKQALLRVTKSCLLAELKPVGKESLAPSSVCEKKTLINVMETMSLWQVVLLQEGRQ